MQKRIETTYRVIILVALGWLLFEARSARNIVSETNERTKVSLIRDKTEIEIKMPPTWTSTVCCNGLATQLTTTGTYAAHLEEIAKANKHCTTTGGTTNCP